MGKVRRSGRATGMMIGGIATLLVGVLLGIIGPVVIFVLTGDATAFLLLLFVPTTLLVGCPLLLIGLRTTVQIHPDAVSWTTAFASPQSVPFSQIAQIEVPDGRRGGPGVRLHLRDGQVVPLTALKMSSGDAGHWADPWYRRLSGELVQAHQAYLSSGGRR